MFRVSSEVACKEIVCVLPAVRRTQPIYHRPECVQQPMPNCYYSYMASKNKIVSYIAPFFDTTKERGLRMFRDVLRVRWCAE